MLYYDAYHILGNCACAHESSTCTGPGIVCLCRFVKAVRVSIFRMLPAQEAEHGNRRAFFQEEAWAHIRVRVINAPMLY